MVHEGQSEPLGATILDGGTNFAVWAPDADRVELCLFTPDGGHWNVDLPGFTKVFSTDSSPISGMARNTDCECTARGSQIVACDLTPQNF